MKTTRRQFVKGLFGLACVGLVIKEPAAQVEEQDFGDHFHDLPSSSSWDDNKTGQDIINDILEMKRRVEQPTQYSPRYLFIRGEIIQVY